jgi:hypothetical protein
MDNHRKLAEALLKADGIDPEGATESERRALGKMLDQQSNSKPSKPLLRPEIWRMMMKSKITKFAAAIIIIAALIVVYQFTGSIDGASVVWADVIKNIDRVNDYIFRERQMDHSGVKPTGFEFVNEWETIWYYSSEFGSRNDLYRSGKLIGQFYVLLKEQQLISIHPNEKSFSRRDEPMPQSKSIDPRGHIRQVISKPHIKLGRKMIDGMFAEGIEVEGQEVSGVKLDDAVSRLWVDIHTQLPVRLESEGKMYGTDMFSLLIQDRFQWNVNLTKADFTPDIPADFTQKDWSKSNPKWDEVVAAYTKQVRLVDFSPLQRLGLLYDDKVSGQPTSTLTGMEEINEARDRMIRSWPGYDDLRQSLHDTLNDKLVLESLSVDQLVSLGVLLREKFWDAGGTFSPVSYRYAYMSRVLLELAHAQRPDDLAIGDQLAEAIMAAGTMLGTEGYVETLFDIRSSQFRQIRKEVETGRRPEWDDFARGCDLINFASCRKPDEAVAAVDWLIQHAGDGRWTSCLETLQWMRPLVAEGKGIGFNIYYPIRPGYPEEFTYLGRPPSFKGPNSRIVIPIPAMEEPPSSDGHP